VNIGGENIPLNAIEKNISMIKHDIPVVILCKSGARSLLAIEKLNSHGFSNLLNMKGGIIKWIDDVNPNLVKY
jgi:adenylyltransferase/sulfurtransferase